MPCANCRLDLPKLELSEDPTSTSGCDIDIIDDFTYTFINTENGETLPVSDAIKIIFEGTLKLNKKHISPTTRVKMCTDCLDGLSELHRSYTKFLKLTKEASYIQQLLETTSVWTFVYDGESHDFTPMVEVKLEEVKDEDVIVIKEEVDDPDFECNYSPTEDEDEDDEEEKYPFIRATRRTTAAKRLGLRRRGRPPKSRAKTSKAANKSRPGKSKISPKTNRKPRASKDLKEERYGDKALKCEEEGCKKAFNCSKLLRRHMKYQHGGAAPEELELRTCKQCPKPKVFGTPSQLRYHVEAVHATELPFDCLKCDRKFPTKNRLSIHNIMKHSTKSKPKEKEPIVCPHSCSDTFRSQVSLRLHLKSVHNEEITFECPTCGKKFQRGTRYRRHLKYKHGEGLTEADLEGRSCSMCPKIFETPSQLRYHQQSVHVTERPFECEECGRRFPTKNYLSIHRLLKHERASVRHPCNICEKTYSSKHALQDHIDSVHLRKRDIVCEVCGKKFSRRNELNRHMEIHDPARKPTWMCNECGQYFISDKTLKSHMKTHSGVKDQLCPVCGDAFLHVASLRRHLHAKHGIVHSAGVDSKGGHTCDQCGKTFKLKEYLRQHLRSRTHGGKGHTAQRKREATIGLTGGDNSDESIITVTPHKRQRKQKLQIPQQNISLPPEASIIPTSSLTPPTTRYEIPSHPPPIHPTLFWAHGHPHGHGNTHFY